jgi:hypothetical protein
MFRFLIERAVASGSGSGSGTNGRKSDSCYPLGKFLPLEWMTIRMYKRKRICKQVGR